MMVVQEICSSYSQYNEIRTIRYNFHSIATIHKVCVPIPKKYAQSIAAKNINLFNDGLQSIVEELNDS